MAICVRYQNIKTNVGQLTVLVPSPISATTCNGYILQERGDSLQIPPLTLQQAGEISVACAVFWFTTTTMRHILRFINSKETNDE